MSPRAAYVVHIQGFNKSVKTVATCPELSPELVEKVCDAAKSWRDDKYRLHRLWNLLTNKELPGLAVVYDPSEKKSIPLVQPLDVPFEPLILDETSPTVVQLAEHALDGPIDEDRRSRRSSLVRRFFIRIGLPTFWLIYWGTRAIQFILEHGLHSWRGQIGLVAFVLTIVVPIGVLWLRQRQWIVIPGGLIVRKTSLRRLKTSMRRFTAAEAVLILAWRQPGWEAQILSEGEIVEKRKLTPLECVALLAAWQNPLPPPEMSKMVDLQ